MTPRRFAVIVSIVGAVYFRRLELGVVRATRATLTGEKGQRYVIIGERWRQAVWCVTAYEAGVNGPWSERTINRSSSSINNDQDVPLQRRRRRRRTCSERRLHRGGWPCDFKKRRAPSAGAAFSFGRFVNEPPFDAFARRAPCIAACVALFYVYVYVCACVGYRWRSRQLERWSTVSPVRCRKLNRSPSSLQRVPLPSLVNNLVNSVLNNCMYTSRYRFDAEFGKIWVKTGWRAQRSLCEVCKGNECELCEVLATACHDEQSCRNPRRRWESVRKRSSNPSEN